MKDTVEKAGFLHIREAMYVVSTVLAALWEMMGGFVAGPSVCDRDIAT
jgi:hypothetical protein